MNKATYIITGPTASGKSGFAHALARKVGGVIINCDSVQIYRGIENISASPFANRDLSETIDGVPYKLFSILPLDKQISVVDYLNLARTEYQHALDAGMVPIFVGGTGYYINAIINGISPMPDVGDKNRERARKMVESDINSARELLPSDFSATDPQRVARALEVFFETGHHITEFQNMPRIGAIAPGATKILINPPLDILHKRIALRVREMVSAGAMAEAEQIIANNWNPERAIGAVQLVDYISGKISFEKCIENWITKTKQYAKRQRTWFRGQFSADYTFNTIPTHSDVSNLLK